MEVGDCLGGLGWYRGTGGRSNKHTGTPRVMVQAAMVSQVYINVKPTGIFEHVRFFSTSIIS